MENNNHSVQETESHFVMQHFIFDICSYGKKGNMNNFRSLQQNMIIENNGSQVTHLCACSELSIWIGFLGISTISCWPCLSLDCEWVEAIKILLIYQLDLLFAYRSTGYGLKRLFEIQAHPE